MRIDAESARFVVKSFRAKRTRKNTSMSATEYEIILVGVNLEQVVRYSLKIKGVTLDEVFDMLMDPNNRDELRLSEKTIQTTKKIEIIGKNKSRSLRIGLKERDDHILLNVIFYRLEINNFITNDVTPYARMRFGYIKEILTNINSSVQLESADDIKNTSYLLLSISKDFEGIHGELSESILHSKLKIILFLTGIVLIGILFWNNQIHTGTIATLSVILYIVFEATLYKRNRPSLVNNSQEK